LKYEIGVNGDGVRGCVALQDFAPGQIIAKMPFKLAVTMNEDVEYMAGHTYEILYRMHVDRKFNETHGLWIATQPGPDNVFGPETWTTSQASALQSPWLADLSTAMKELAALHYNGQYLEDDRGRFQIPLNDAIAPDHVTLDQFMYTTALVQSRYFEFDRRELYRMWLFPAIDLFNDCYSPLCNAANDNDEDFVYIFAVKDIKKGDEITMSYTSHSHRPDMSLAKYGFVMNTNPNPPLLAGQDMPDFDPEDPFVYFELEDTYPTLRPEVEEEIERCQRILDGLPTSLDEDMELIKTNGGTMFADWKDLEILKFRIARKKALWYRIEKLKAGLVEEEAVVMKEEL
jgi:hypothetical protein